MGRSAYICPQLSCLEAARKKNRLGRSLKVNVPEAIYQELWQRLSTNQQLNQEDREMMENNRHH
jgi:hypothetical protein